jgi:phage terminase large subunit-like protein
MAERSVPAGFDPREWEKWDDKSKDRLLAALAAAEKTKKVWYCTKGRLCDGKPHDEYSYPHARGDQWPPEGDDWLVWLLKGGRGSGKTRSGSEWMRKMSIGLERTSIIGPTISHIRDTMVEGESGLLAVFDNAKISALWEPSKRRITIACKCKGTKHRGGHMISAFTGDEPERLRGPQHAAVWLDEPAHFALIEAVWDNMMFGLRLGKHPRVLCSTTPLPTKWMKKLIAEEDTVAVTVSTYANMDNLAPSFKKVMLSKYEGTRLGRQELYGEVLEDIVGALWTWAMIQDNAILPSVTEDNTLYYPVTHAEMDRVIVAIDPAGTSSKKRDETGIVVVGKAGEHFYVLADYSGTFTPEGWASEAWKAFDKYQADKVVAEKNYGGEMVLSTLRNSRSGGPVDLVHSRRGKALRAEPVVGLYEQDRVHHLQRFEKLEEQMTEWVPGASDSPDRVDALVHGITALYEGGGPASFAMPKGNLRKGGAIEGLPEPVQGRRPSSKLFGYTPRSALQLSEREMEVGKLLAARSLVRQ